MGSSSQSLVLSSMFVLRGQTGRQNVLGLTSLLAGHDILLWGAHWNVVYTVRSGYHWIPPKIRCFMWKAFSRALATMEALYRRRCSPTPICPICHACEESIEHMLLLCPWVETLWFGGSLNYKVDRASITSLANWFSSLMNSHLGSMVDVTWLLLYIAFTCFPFAVGKLSPFAGFFVWLGHVVSPEFPFMKVNVDASWSVTTSEGFVGVVVRNSDGRFVAVRKWQTHAPSTMAVEANAIFVGWEAFPTLTRILRLMDVFQRCRWSWVLRSANMAAHRLASRSNTEMCGSSWVNQPPSSLVHILNKDGLPCPP
ncbi:hypothetical protein PS2_045096 [Malus domestica]